MTLFGKSLRDYVSFARSGVALILAMGVVRFAVGVSGVPYDRATDLVSVTILTFLLAVIYGQRAAARGFGTYRHLLPTAVSFSLAMYGFIILAMTVEAWGGISGYFHSPGSGYAPPEMALGDHILGQLSVMGIMTLAILGVSALGYALSRELAFLKNGLLFLAALAVVRFFAGIVGVPHAVGTWLTSLTAAGAFLAGYAGFRAPSRGFGRLRDPLVLSFLIAFVVTHLVAYGIAITAGLGISTYFHAPGGLTKQEHIIQHLWFSPRLMLLFAALASAGFLLGKKGASTMASSPTATTCSMRATRPVMSSLRRPPPSGEKG